MKEMPLLSSPVSTTVAALRQYWALSDASTGIAARLYRRVAVSPLKDDPSNGRSAPLGGR